MTVQARNQKPVSSKPILRTAVAAAIMCAAAAAFAQMRTLPGNTERGYLQHVTQNQVTVDGRSLLLAPGATIRDTRNLIVVPAALPPGGALAEYQLDGRGQIARVWLLTAEEAAREKPPRPR
jgi:hypothetical protein